jgi:two-component system, chemotaxis family, CheB/CheR fusion protein
MYAETLATAEGATVNSELKTRVDELSCANSGLVNLLECTQIAMFVADRDFALKSFTTAAKDLFHFVETDVGRPVSHIRARLRLDNVQDHAKRVLHTLFPVEQHVESADDAKSYIMRILPYRTVENVIAGVVVTFVDITRITAAEAEVAALTHELRNRVENLQRILDLVPVGMLIGGVDTMQHIQINRYAARLLGEKTDIRGPETYPYLTDYLIINANCRSGSSRCSEPFSRVRRCRPLRDDWSPRWQITGRINVGGAVV